MPPNQVPRRAHLNVHQVVFIFYYIDFFVDTIYLKVLVPSIAAGAIIGKNGEAIGQMQKETGAKIKLSKLNDFYPGILPLFRFCAHNEI